MTARTVSPEAEPAMTHPGSLVWIDAREAILVRWPEDQAQLERVESEVPARRRATGHVRHDPLIRHGGGGLPQDAGEPRRLEYLQRFLEQVADLLPSHQDVLILGRARCVVAWTGCSSLAMCDTDTPGRSGPRRRRDERIAS